MDISLRRKLKVALGNAPFRLKGIGHVVLGMLLAACSSTSHTEKQPHGTKLFFIQIQASQEGISVQTNNVFAGKTPLTLVVLASKEGTFHNFGAPQYVIQAVPALTNGIWPTQAFRTGSGSTPGDRIPGTIFFDMEHPSASFSVDTFPDN